MVKIKLGDKARDLVTGLEGVVIARTTWLYGCNRLTIQAEAKDGKVPEPVSFDEPQLERIKPKKVKPASKAQRETGGPRPELSKRSSIL